MFNILAANLDYVVCNGGFFFLSDELSICGVEFINLIFMSSFHHIITDFSLIALQLEACAHPFFDELREPNSRLPNGHPLPPLFNFKQEVCNRPFLFS